MTTHSGWPWPQAALIRTGSSQAWKSHTSDPAPREKGDGATERSRADVRRYRHRPDSLSRLEQLDRIAVRIFQLDLLAARADFHVVAKMESGLFQLRDPRSEIGHLKNHAIPSTGLATERATSLT